MSSLRVLRLLRVFRSLKLLRQVEGLNKIVNVVLKASLHVCDAPNCMLYCRQHHACNILDILRAISVCMSMRFTGQHDDHTAYLQSQKNAAVATEHMCQNLVAVIQ